MKKNRREKNTFFMRIAKGAVIGAAAMLPGASGGVLAVAMGIYRNMIDAIIEFFTGKRMKANFRYLLPLGIGGVTGLLLVSRSLEWLLLRYEMPMMYAFLGMVLGGVPSLIREANESAGGFRKRYLFATLIGAAIIAGITIIEGSFNEGQAWPVNSLTAIAGGAILAIGIVIPGVSTSLLLMHVGIYMPLLTAFNTFDLPILACMALGAAMMAALLILLIKKAFDRHPGYSYYGVLGFLIGTIVLVFPGAEWSITQLISVMVMMLGALLTFWMCSRPKHADEAETPQSNAKK